MMQHMFIAYNVVQRSNRHVNMTVGQGLQRHHGSEWGAALINDRILYV